MNTVVSFRDTTSINLFLITKQTH